MHGEAPQPEPAFHEGEVALQREAGVAEKLARLGPQIMQTSLLEPQRRLLSELPFVVVGSMDPEGQPTASLLAGPPGFVSSIDPAQLRIDAAPHPDSPLHQNLRAGAPLAVLGIQQHTRRRHRVNGKLSGSDARGFVLDVHQSFGNCPKYIHPRRASYVGLDAQPRARASESLGAEGRALMASADTFYIASAHPAARADGPRSHGVDVSHRGGPPGVVCFTDEATFSVPDFSGNNFHNTLGNLRLHSPAGLLFMDISNGDLLELEARAELVQGSHPLAGPHGTGRVLRFRMHQARFFPGASPLRFEP